MGILVSKVSEKVNQINQAIKVNHFYGAILFRGSIDGSLSILLKDELIPETEKKEQAQVDRLMNLKNSLTKLLEGSVVLYLDTETGIDPHYKEKLDEQNSVDLIEENAYAKILDNFSEFRCFNCPDGSDFPDLSSRSDSFSERECDFSSDSENSVESGSFFWSARLCTLPIERNEPRENEEFLMHSLHELIQERTGSNPEVDLNKFFSDLQIEYTEFVEKNNLDPATPVK